MPRRSVILGVWTNLPTRKLEHFLASIIFSGFEGDVVLFVHGLALETMRDLKRYGIQTRDAGPYIRQDMSIQTSRYMMYLDFLIRAGGLYDHVMLTDVRDVIFQSDPFSSPLAGDVVFAMERVEIGTCRYNSTWANEAYGPQYLRQVRHLPVSCSGTTFGTTDGMMRYLALMVGEVLTAQAKMSKSQRGIDQGFHGRIVHFNPPDGACCDTQERLVATLAYVPDESVRIAEATILLDGRAVPVVHQWDRKKSVADLVTGHPRYRLAAQARISSAGKAMTAPADLVVYYDDGNFSQHGWRFTLATLRASGFDGRIVCLTSHPNRTDGDLSLYGCDVVHVPTHGLAVASMVCANWLAGANDRDFGKVLVLDSPDFIFISNPFTDMRHRLEFHAEGGAVIGDCPQTMACISRLGGDAAGLERRYIVSVSAVSGVFEYARKFFKDFQNLLRAHSDNLVDSISVRSLFNLAAYAERQSYPSAVLPNGALVLLQQNNDPALVEFVPTFRYNKIRPCVIQSPYRHEYLRRALQFEVPAELWTGGPDAARVDSQITEKREFIRR